MGLFSFLSKSSEPVKLPFATDIHCHILPGVDDGSPDAQTSAELVERMRSWGISRIIATPHITEGTFENTPEDLDAALESLKAELEKRNIDMPLSRASENRIDDYFRCQLTAGNITPYPNNYILVENSFIQEPWQLDQFLFDLKLKGYRPILAHPERFFYYFEEHPNRYDELHRAGNLFQINVLSLAGAYTKKEKKTAEKLIEKGYVDFLGTDLHNHRHADTIEAYLSSKDATRHFAALQGRLFNDRVFV
ncbi:MAG: hypothetical protein K2H17_05535 [Duncaniella sp.]|uniref:tyrosine-protein phosphatase n=1 Tax=Duncaniella sp. TaxID=2518496 RepID=UPI0023D5C9C4|nr:CpsB/CapC family capsule biosynthesis tyrosine phosphatase [Duncaniella sp.]MDE5988839.1 hypothetical protein [Duncaniella sp.]